MAERTPEFAKDELYEAHLEEANRVVVGWGEEEGREPDRPILFVVGPPRSGTTLLYQLLAATGGFLYPSNLIARFYGSPAWGARMQRILEPLLPRGQMGFTSRAGNTDAWWEPHEFGYFWERHFDFRAHHQPPMSELNSLARALAAFQDQGPGPLLLKSNLLSFVLPQLAAALPTARFIRVRRDPLDTAASIHRTRIRFFGDAGTWWSIRPADADPAAPPDEQIAHQLSRVDGALLQARESLGDRLLETSYHELCRDPRGVIRTAGQLVEVELETAALPASFSPSDKEIDPEVQKRLEGTLRGEGLI